MLQDAAELPAGHLLQADICIVGAGAAGITLALALRGRGLHVLLVESGGTRPEAATQALYEGEVADAQLHTPPIRYRQRRLGGTTTIWGGRCMPFDAIDFERRDQVPHSGWPISRDELARYYPRANALCEAGDWAYTLSDAFPQGAPPMIEGFRSDSFSVDRLERFSCPTDFGRRYRAELTQARDVTVLLHANLVNIQLNQANERVEQLVLQTLPGRRLHVRARQHVLATGGLETARLLLANCQGEHALGNAHDVVGRYYMCHLAGTIGAIRIERPVSAVHHGYLRARDGVYCRPRFALDEAVQRQLGLGNFVARLHHPRITDPAHQNPMLSLLYLAKPLIPYEYAVRLHGGAPADFASWRQHLKNVACGPFEAAGFAWHLVRDRMLARRKFPSIIIHSRANLFSLDFHAEQFPNPASRVTLSDQRDALGLPRLRIDWRYTPADIRSIERALELLATSFRESRLGSFDYDPASVELETTRYGAYGGHHIGTARMGNDPRSSVVNADLRLHSVDNLYIAGSAAFPTSSQANPTLTIVALALRLAEHLGARRAA